MAEISLFDVLIIGLTLLLGISGIVKGLILELFGLFGIIGGVIIASRFGSNAGELVVKYVYPFKDASLANFVGFLVILVLFWLVCLVLGKLFSKLITAASLGTFNKVGGFIFSSAKFFLIFALLLFLLAKFEFLQEKLEKFTKNSFTAPYLLKTGAFILNDERVKEVTEQVKEGLEQQFEGLNDDKI